DDEDRGADLDTIEEPLRVRNTHPDAAVGGRVPDRGRVRSPVDSDSRGREAHPASAERVARARRNRARAGRPRGVGRIPPRVSLLRDDRELPGRSRVDRLPDRDAEARPEAHVRALVEVETMRPAADDDHRLEVRASHLGLHGAVPDGHWPTRVRPDRLFQDPARWALADDVAVQRLREMRAQVAETDVRIARLAAEKVGELLGVVT